MLVVTYKKAHILLARLQEGYVMNETAAYAFAGFRKMNVEVAINLV